MAHLESPGDVQGSTSPDARGSASASRVDSPQVYAVYVDNKDIVWLSDFGANAMLRFDPKTEQFTTYKSKSRNASVRQILGRPGEVWLPESGSDKLVMIWGKWGCATGLKISLSLISITITGT